MATNNVINLGRGTFSVELSATTGGVTGNGAAYYVLCDNVLVDEASAYTAGTGTYVTPVAGNYLFTAVISLGTVTALSTTNVSPTLVVGGNSYNLATNNIGTIVSAGGTIVNAGSLILPLAAGTSVRLLAYVNGEVANTVTVVGAAAPSPTRWSGCLLL